MITIITTKNMITPYDSSSRTVLIAIEPPLVMKDPRPLQDPRGDPRDPRDARAATVAPEPPSPSGRAPPLPPLPPPYPPPDTLGVNPQHRGHHNTWIITW